MVISFWGVRGSIPAPGKHTARYGGNTACVSVQIQDKILIIDAGTGIRALGNKILGGKQEIFIMLSHLHSDHFYGFPFFRPLYEDGRLIHLLDYQENGETWTLLDLIDGFHFPVSCDELPSTVGRVGGDVLKFMRQSGFDLTLQAVNHPGGAFGIRIDHEGGSFVHIPDHELEGPNPVVPTSDIINFCREADILCHDAQYLQEDMPQKYGWGHSLVQQACDLSVAAQVKHLVLFHHDPDRTDEEIDEIQRWARDRLEAHNIACTAGYEGLEFRVPLA